MKRIIIFATLLVAIVGCSPQAALTDNLTGKWIVYKVLDHGIDLTKSMQDSLAHYTISYTGGGQFTEVDTVISSGSMYTVSGTWAFQNNFEKLLLTDSVYHQRVYTIFNLEGNHVELTKEGVTRYMRKVQ